VEPGLHYAVVYKSIFGVFVFRAEFDKQDLRNAFLDDEDGKKGLRCGKPDARLGSTVLHRLFRPATQKPASRIGPYSERLSTHCPQPFRSAQHRVGVPDQQVLSYFPAVRAFIVQIGVNFGFHLRHG
jgi:hypothetical protein